MLGTWGTGGVRYKDGSGKQGDALAYFDHDLGKTLWMLVWENNAKRPSIIDSKDVLIKHLGDKSWSKFHGI
jgi:hypothetical protein